MHFDCWNGGSFCSVSWMDLDLIRPRMTQPLPSTGIHFFMVRIEKTDKDRLASCPDLQQISIGVGQDPFDANRGWSIENRGIGWSNTGDLFKENIGFDARYYGVKMMAGDEIGFCIDQDQKVLRFIQNDELMTGSSGGSDHEIIHPDQTLYPYLILANNIKNAITIIHPKDAPSLLSRIST
eukprot:TRINITY_DN3126_c0_g1_i3.p1 TRINITY_DN3126_c0_g1~~TRINITY_DN3126_c0_g1_i3.p1  ORF type:complete len:181 (+),score=44.27 TRINITY_DN3126_c0_g1_i3:292-834(+)